MAVDIEKMVMHAEQNCGNQDGNNHRHIFFQSQQILKQNHQQADQKQAEDQFLVNSRTDSRNNIPPQARALGGRLSRTGNQRHRERRGGLFRDSGRTIHRQTEHNQWNRQQDTLDGHRHKIADADLPFGAAGDLQPQQDNHHDKGWGNPGHPLRKTDVFEQVLYPDKRHDAKLRLIETLGQDVRVNIKGSDFIKQQEAQQVHQRIDRPAGSIQIRIWKERNQLAGGAFCLMLAACHRTSLSNPDSRGPNIKKSHNTFYIQVVTAFIPSQEGIQSVNA